MIDKMGDTGLAGLWHQRLAKGFKSFALMGIEQPEWNATRPCLVGRHDDVNATDRECQSAHGRAFHEAAPANACHGHLLPE
jgi:hypothetical protein